MCLENKSFPTFFTNKNVFNEYDKKVSDIFCATEVLKQFGQQILHVNEMNATPSFSDTLLATRYKIFPRYIHFLLIGDLHMIETFVRIDLGILTYLL